MVIIYSDDMLLMSQRIEELLFSRDTVIFLLIHLGFVINLKESMLNPVQKIEFLGLEIDSVAMKLSLPQRKVEEIVQMSQNALNNKITLRELTQLIGKLTSTVQAILPAKLQIRFLQQIQIKALRKSLAYESLITLDLQAMEELSWWMTNIKMYNGRPLSIEA